MERERTERWWTDCQPVNLPACARTLGREKTIYGVKVYLVELKATAGELCSAQYRLRSCGTVIEKVEKGQKS